MGACVSRSPLQSSTEIHSNGHRSQNRIRVMRFNGMLREFSSPVLVAELMFDHPQHFVFRSTPNLNPDEDHEKSQLVMSPHEALPADVQLELGQLYYLLPSVSRRKYSGAAAAEYTKFRKLRSDPNNKRSPLITKKSSHRRRPQRKNSCIVVMKKSVGRQLGRFLEMLKQRMPHETRPIIFSNSNSAHSDDQLSAAALASIKYTLSSSVAETQGMNRNLYNAEAASLNAGMAEELSEMWHAGLEEELMHEANRSMPVTAMSKNAYAWRPKLETIDEMSFTIRSAMQLRCS